MASEFLFVEKYRPHTIDDCILSDDLKETFKEFVALERVPNLLLTGSPGTGKTTVARALCEEIGLSYLFINSSDERGIDTLRTKIKSFASTLSLDGKLKVIIMDEADYVTPEAQAALRGAMEQFSKNCTFILTCNFKSKLIDAIHSRCTVIDFEISKKDKMHIALYFLRRVETILDSEGVSYDKKTLARIINEYFPDFRRTLNEIQRLSTIGVIDEASFESLKRVENLDVLFEHLKEKNFKDVRKWVVENNIDSSSIYRGIFNILQHKLKGTSVAQAVLILSKYQYQAAFVADQELNLVACLIELMVDCEYA